MYDINDLLKFYILLKISIMQKHHPLPPHKKTQRYPFFCLLFLASAISIILHLIYLYSAQDLTVPKPQYLNRIFKKQPYSKIADKLQQNQYGIIQTDCKQCVNELIQHIGYELSRPIFVRDYTQLEGVSKIARPLLWSITLLIRNYIVEPYPKPKIWALHINKQQINTDIEQIKSLEPRSTIFVVVPLKSNIKYKEFKKLGKLQNFDVQQVLKSVKIPKQLAEVYSNYHNHSVPHIFNSITRRSKTMQQHLGKYHIPLNSLSTKGFRVLTQLCKNGKLKQNTQITEKMYKKLQKYGLKITRGIAYWKDDRYRLNFMLQNKTNCVKIDPPFQLIQAEEIAKQEVKQQANVQTSNKCECKIENTKENEKDLQSKQDNKKQQSVKLKAAAEEQEQETNQKQENENQDRQNNEQKSAQQKQDQDQEQQVENNKKQEEEQKQEQDNQQNNVNGKNKDENENQDQDDQEDKQDEEKDQDQHQEKDEEKNKDEQKIQADAKIEQNQQQQKDDEQDEQQQKKDDLNVQEAQHSQKEQSEQKAKQIDQIIAKVEKIHQQQL